MNILFFENDDRFIFGLPLGFRDAGYKIIVSGTINEEKVYKLLKKFKPAMVILMGWTTQHTDYNLKLISTACDELTIPIIYWATEDPTFINEFSIPLIKKTNPKHVFTVSKSCISIYQSLGIEATHLPFAYQPSLHTPVKCEDWCSKDIAVVANAYPNVLNWDKNHYRKKSLEILIKPLIDNNVPIDFWGKHWDKMDSFLGKPIDKKCIHGYINYLQSNKIYRCSKINIGLQNYKDELITMRTFEILGSCGFLITSYNLRLCELFTPNDDLIVSSCKEETLEYVDFYSKHDTLREKIKVNGNKAVQIHTYRNRAEKIISTLKKEGII
ncbi:spore protein YkvP [Vallitalea longa]|uniref:Spore protein YkvP n=1 Tax=Vallitalea longa TaxID=2936439 RepID=A0A9W5YBA8_9FIRM|nr:glycosyltransferase [Vallitalea longa]GKX30835.1 spore protein YkvP [Vallitalea longa]